MNRGFVKYWRKRWDKGYHLNPLLWVMMDYFIDFANHQDREIFVPRVGMVLVKRGQHLYGTESLAKFMGVSRKKIRLRIEILKNIGFLEVAGATQYSVATVINYDTYNPYENKRAKVGPIKGQRTGQQRAGQNPAELVMKEGSYNQIKNGEGQQKGQPPSLKRATPKKLRSKDKDIKKSGPPAPVPSKLPTQEIINDASLVKIKSDLEMICERLYTEKIFPKAPIFKNTMLKKKKNPRAILHTLVRCYAKGKNIGFEKGGPWGYCHQIIDVENGNFNELEYQKTEN